MTRDESLYAVRDFARSLRVGDTIRVPRGALGLDRITDLIECTVMKKYTNAVLLHARLNKDITIAYMPAYGTLYCHTHDATTGEART